MKKVFKYVKYAIYLFALGLFIILLFRSCTVNAPDEFTELLWNDTLISAYESNPDSFRVYYIREYENNYSSEDGKFNFCCVRSIDSAEQWQLTVGCNDSTVNDLAEKIGRDLSSDEENFTFILKDQDGNIYSEYDYIYTHTNRHGFRRLAFDGIPKNSVSKLFLCIYYTGDIENGQLPKKPLETFTVYNSSLIKENYTGDDAKKPSEKRTELTHHDTLTEVIQNDN